MKRDVVLVDAGGSNLGSVRFALERLGVDAPVSADPARIAQASHVILPGVGAAAAGMAAIARNGLAATLRGLSQPLLGVCLGMQLLFEYSEEGDVACLGLLPGRVQALAPGPGLRVPHMGWNRLLPERESPLLAGLGDAAYAYFVHGFAAPVSADTVASCEHGRPFAAVVSRGNVHGAQFHPERSAATGARLLKNFLDLEA